MKRVAVALSSLALAAVSQNAASASVPRALAKQCKAELRQFGNVRKEAWKPAFSALAKHAEVRARAGIALPTEATMVLVYMAAGHHTSVRLSYVATLTATGDWHVDFVGEDGPGVLSIPIETRAPRSWFLSAGNSALLSHLLENPCLHAEPPSNYSRTVPARGAVDHVLDIVTPNWSRTHYSLDAMPGLNGEILALITYEPRFPDGLPLRIGPLDYSIPR